MNRQLSIFAIFLVMGCNLHMNSGERPRVPALNFTGLKTNSEASAPLSPTEVDRNVSPDPSGQNPQKPQTPLQKFLKASDPQNKQSPLMLPRTHSDLGSYVSYAPVPSSSGRSALGESIKKAGLRSDPCATGFCSHRKPCPPSSLSADEMTACERQFQDVMCGLNEYLQHVKSGYPLEDFPDKTSLFNAIANEAKYGEHVSPMLAQVAKYPSSTLTKIQKSRLCEIRDLILSSVPK